MNQIYIDLYELQTMNAWMKKNELPKVEIHVYIEKSFK